MRGEGQIAQLVEIAEPDVGVVVNVGPVHLELLGTLERVAAAKAELIRGLHPHAACVVPANEELLAEHLRDDLDTISFGEGGDVTLALLRGRPRARSTRAARRWSSSWRTRSPTTSPTRSRRWPRPTALGITPSGRVEPRFSSLRGEVRGAARRHNGGERLLQRQPDVDAGGARAPGGTRRPSAGSPSSVSMAELGADEARFHREIGDLASNLEIDVLITVGEQAV